MQGGTWSSCPVILSEVVVIAAVVAAVGVVACMRELGSGE